MTSLTTPEIWEERHRSGGKSYPRWTDYADCDTIRALRPFMESRSGGRLLEMGCGSSYWLPYFAVGYGYSVAGMDFSATRLGQTAKLLAQRGIEGELVVGDFLAPLPDAWRGRFDIVYSSGVVEHFSHPGDAIRKFGECLSPGGIMLTLVPLLNGVWGDLDAVLSQGKGEYRRMSADDVVRAHREAGLRVQHIECLRWGDMSVVSCSALPRVVQLAYYGVAASLGLFLRPFSRLGNRLFPSLSAGVLVVASR